MNLVPFVRVTVWSVRMTLAGVLGYAGWAKLQSPPLFTATIAKLQMVPFSWAEWVGSAVAVAEILMAGWLLCGVRRRAAALAVTCLASVFAAAMAQASARGLDLDCHCFGATESPLPTAWVLVRALTVLVAGVFLWTRSAPRALL
jgi:uncharacterized membrane protein YphA (DoxX/SURF4 family)